MADATVRVSAITTPPMQLGGGVAFAQMWNVFSSESLVSTGEIDSVGNGGSTGSFGITIPLGAYFGVWVSATGSTGGTTGIPNYTISLLQSYSDTSTANYVRSGAKTLLSSGSGSTAITFNDHLPHVFALSPVPLPFARIRITNATTSTGSVSVNAFLWAVK